MTPLANTIMSGVDAEALDPEPGAKPPETAMTESQTSRIPWPRRGRRPPRGSRRGRVQDAAGADDRLEEEGGHALGSDALDLLLEREQRVVLHLGVFGISGPKAARLPSMPPRLVPKPNTPWKLPLRLITCVRCGWPAAAQ